MLVLLITVEVIFNRPLKGVGLCVNASLGVYFLSNKVVKLQ